MKLFVANWKMNKTRGQARAFAAELGREIGGGARRRRARARAAFYRLSTRRGDPEGRWSIAGQNCAAEPEGAFTGEVSALDARRMRMPLRDRRATRSGAGTSARTSRSSRRKLARCREAGLTPIYCVGETADGAGRGPDRGHARAPARRPGRDPRAPAARRRLRARLGDRHRAATRRPRTREAVRPHRGDSSRIAATLRVLYGGSVTPANAADLARQRGASTAS